jgi:N-acyl-phosphatidylethanolamine-hydrolysing phospholipase D
VKTEVTFTPAKHWTKRTFWDQNHCLWGGFAVRAPSSSWYFAGDSAWDEVLFKTIGEELGPFDLASIGIGAYRPRAVMADSHTNPAEALDIFRDVNAERFHGMHWGTWKLADEANVEPAFDLGMAREERGLTHDVAFTMDMGTTMQLNDPASMGQTDLVYQNPKLYEEFKTMDRGDIVEKTILTLPGTDYTTAL